MVRRNCDTGSEDDAPDMDIPEDMIDDPGAEDDATGNVEETTDLVTVAQAGSMREARTMKSILESAEITAFIGQEDASLTQPDGVTPGIPVLVPEGMVAEAEEILVEATMDADDELDEEELKVPDWDVDDDEDDFLDELDDDDDDDDDYDEFDDDEEDEEY